MSYHVPVLLSRSIEGLNIKPDGIYVDVTFGGGGYSREILSRLSEEGRLCAFDQDEDALKNRIDDSRFELFHHNFRYMKNVLRFSGVNGVDGIVADLGISSYQIDTPDKGFSTRFESLMDMRMDRRGTVTAADVLNTYDLEALTRVFRLYGEIDNAFKLANVIVKARGEAGISDSGEFKKMISGCLPRGRESKYLAQLFQALRIEVNDELGALKELLVQSVEMLNEGGRLVVISYHSLEDRLVKNFMRSGNIDGVIEKDFYGNVLTSLKVITRKPIVSDDDELTLNPRSRSAKLRVAEKV